MSSSRRLLGGGGEGGPTKARPSDPRRAALRAADESGDQSVRILSNLLSIEKYYSAAEKVLAAFQSAYNAKHLNDAYVLGRRFAAFSSKSLPTHDYYLSPQEKYAKLRAKNQEDLARVIDQLEQVVTWMDEEELEKQRLEKLRRAEEEKRRRREILLAKKRRQEELERQQLLELDGDEMNDIEHSAMMKLAMLDFQLPTAPAGFDANKSPNNGTTRGGKRDSLSSLRSVSDSAMKFNINGGVGSRENNATELSSRSFSSLDFPPPPSLPPSAPSASSHPPPPLYEDDLLPLPMPLPPPDNEAEGFELTPPPPSYADIMKGNIDMSGGTRNLGGSTTQPAAAHRPQLPSYSNLFPSPSSSKLQPTAAAAGGARMDDSVPSLYPTFATPEWGDESKKKLRTSLIVPMKELRQIYTNEFLDLKRQKKVEVYTLDTYQGKSKVPGKDSTNGCTVISPLVAAHHLKNQGSGIADCVIEDVIDNEAPPILSHVRSKLGLSADALIIPSDVHDYLVDRKILSQDKFVGACGGNILDPSHVGEFLNTLQNGSSDVHKRKKLGAALFFHEHVVSILKILVSKGGCWFDLVDSMPRRVESSKSSTGSATRTRCKDRHSLEATLRWYACSKFNETESSYIDRNEWDDAMCDFDPRVFQAFVWVE